MTDDVAPFDVSAIHRGWARWRRPTSTASRAKGSTVSDYYGEASCTAGRAAFITGQYPIRTGLTSVGQPGAPQGLKADDVTLATLLKARGYATALFGKSHVGDRNEYLPTVAGFDEFFGLLYHLNVMEHVRAAGIPEEPELPGPAPQRDLFVGDRPRTTRPTSRAGVASASSGSRIAGRWAPSGRRPSTTRCSTSPPTGSSARRRPASPSSCGSTPRACTSRSTSARNGWARADTAAMPTACCTSTPSSASC